MGGFLLENYCQFVCKVQYNDLNEFIKYIKLFDRYLTTALPYLIIIAAFY